MIKFQENTQTGVRREGWTDLISYDPSSYSQGATSTTAVDWHLRVKNKKSDENKKILHHSQHAKNQLNPQTFSVDFRVS